MEIQSLYKAAADLQYLVFDPFNNIHSNVEESLESLGVAKENIFVCSTQKEAISVLRQHKTAFIISYIEPKNKAVFDILDEHQKLIVDNFERYFLLFSENKSIFSFAQALEEDIDDYIVSPYTKDKLTNKILKSLKSKIYPTQYQIMLNEISNKTKSKDFSGAKTMAAIACGLHPRPSMVYYHLSKIENLQGKSSDAISLAIQGLKFNKQHYRCLVQLHELYFSIDDHDRAYRVLKKIFELFPLSMVRMFEIFRLAIVGEKFDELKKYCKEILSKEDENILLIRFCTSGLAICAIRSLAAKEESKASDLLKEALKFSKNDPKILRNLYKVNITHGLQISSEEVFAKFQNKDKECIEWEVCKYLREIHSSKPVGMIIEECEDRFKLVEFDEDCFSQLLKRSTREASVEHNSQLETILSKFNFEK
ncbi:hypothetical protein A9Q84_19150 [Halobacteriovorax marinus]|uniref:Uncharacterized protein n=1 Tax=Halobacteriovorax marinus TaxID=97084 RepID=A0A1Y5F7R8_9BACT|nr:hypothetical protein A9Q84_19150 [Halobacteriovorax marinus]